jgi:hypothetical protein
VACETLLTENRWKSLSREAMEGFCCREEEERLWAARERAGIVAGRRKPAGAKEQKSQDIACHVACFQWL